jgi:hypothetical protein
VAADRISQAALRGRLLKLEVRLILRGNGSAPPLPWERVGVRVYGPSRVLSPLTRIASQSDLSPLGRGAPSQQNGPRFTSRSIAPPMPLTILPGIIQLARSPFCATASRPEWRGRNAPQISQCDALCDCTTGKSRHLRENLSSRRSKNKSLRVDPKSNLQFSPSRSHMRGASRSSRTLEAGCDGRGSVRRNHCATNDAAADGEIAWSWRSDAGAKVVDTNHGRRWQPSMVTGEIA